MSESSHKKRVVVERAPALFVIPCANKECTDGGHDVTSDIMRALRAKMERFEGAHACGGTVANAPCSGVLRFTATAEYS